jgi:hypothetical protein
MLLSQEEWMDLRAFRALHEADATWAEIAREEGLLETTSGPVVVLRFHMTLSYSRDLCDAGELECYS